MEINRLQQGTECSDQHLHDTYSKDQTDKVLKLLAWNVWLDHSTGCIAEHLPNLTQPAQPKPWNSVQMLLKFLLPEGLPTYHMNSVLIFCFDIRNRRSKLFERLHNQVRPTRVGATGWGRGGRNIMMVS